MELSFWGQRGTPQDTESLSRHRARQMESHLNGLKDPVSGRSPRITVTHVGGGAFRVDGRMSKAFARLAADELAPYRMRMRSVTPAPGQPDAGAEQPPEVAFLAPTDSESLEEQGWRAVPGTSLHYRPDPDALKQAALTQTALEAAPLDRALRLALRRLVDEVARRDGLVLSLVGTDLLQTRPAATLALAPVTLRGPETRQATGPEMGGEKGQQTGQQAGAQAGRGNGGREPVRCRSRSRPRSGRRPNGCARPRSWCARRKPIRRRCSPPRPYPSWRPRRSSSPDLLDTFGITLAEGLTVPQPWVHSALDLIRRAQSLTGGQLQQLDTILQMIAATEPGLGLKLRGALHLVTSPPGPANLRFKTDEENVGYLEKLQGYQDFLKGY